LNIIIPIKQVPETSNVKMDEDEWDRNQAKTLLKALVTRGPQEFPRDRLMEDLWPESAQDAAQQNFNVTLW